MEQTGYKTTKANTMKAASQLKCMDKQYEFDNGQLSMRLVVFIKCVLEGQQENRPQLQQQPQTLCSRHDIYSSSQSLREGQEETPKWSSFDF